MSHSGVVLGTGVAAATALPLLAAAAPAKVEGAATLRIVCIGGHPDDPESGAFGALARYSELGHSVTVIYLTRGERGIRDRSLDEAAKIRTAECEAACKVIGAKPAFAGQIDGATEITRARIAEMQRLLVVEAPDLVLTHWPIDTHFDHQAASILTIRACSALTKRPQLYFFEVNPGSQTHNFRPDTYVDITSTVEKKKAALFAHVSQNGQGIWREHHEPAAKFRGREAGVAAAEAFVHLNRDSKLSKLPGV